VKLQKFKVNYKKDRSEKALYDTGRFFTWWNKEDRELFALQFQIRIVKPVAEFSWKFKIGNAGSETPWDGNVQFLGSGIYWGVAGGRNLAHKITTSSENLYGHREISVKIFNGRLYVNLWSDPDNGTKRGWSKSFNLNPLDWMYGERRYSYQRMKSIQTNIDLEEGSYPVEIHLEDQIFKRTRSKKVISRSFVLEVDADKGIPLYLDLNGWKGDRVYGFGVNFPEHGKVRKDWQVDAKALVTAWILEERTKNGYRNDK